MSAPANLSICVAGLSSVGKSSLLKAALEFNEPAPHWTKDAAIPWLRHFIKSYLRDDERISPRGLPPPPNPHENLDQMKLATFRMTPVSGVPYEIDVWDTAGSSFLGLGVPGQPVDQACLDCLLRADLIFLMIAPEDLPGVMNESGRLHSILKSLDRFARAHIEKAKHRPLPAFFCILTKADEYGLSPEILNHGFTLPEWKVLATQHPQTEQLHGHLEATLKALMNINPVVRPMVFFSAAQPENPAMGKSHNAALVVASKYDTHLREGWNLRGVVAIFRNAFEYLHHQRNSPLPVWTTAIVAVAGLLSLILVHDVFAGERAYQREWARWAEEGYGNINNRADLEAFLLRSEDRSLYPDSGAVPPARLTDPSFWAYLMQRPKTPSLLFHDLSLEGRLRREFYALRSKHGLRERRPDYRAWFEKPEELVAIQLRPAPTVPPLETNP